VLLQEIPYTQQLPADCAEQPDAALVAEAGCRLVVGFSASRLGCCGVMLRCGCALYVGVVVYGTPQEWLRAALLSWIALVFGV